MKKTKIENHKEIQSKMNDEREIESIELVVNLFRNKANFRLFIPVKSNAKQIKDIKDHSDAGDLLLQNLTTNEFLPVEVKRLGEDNVYGNFTDLNSWKGSDFIVDGVYQFDNKVNKPYLYLTFNSPMTHFGVVYGRDHKNWTKRVTNGNGSTKEYYVCKPSEVKFKSVVEELAINLINPMRFEDDPDTRMLEMAFGAGKVKRIA